MIIDGYSAEDINNNAMKNMNQYILKRNSELIDRKVIEDIKSDIIRHSKICDPEFKDAFEVTVQIIDKHIGDTV